MRKDNNSNGRSPKPLMPALSSRFRAAKSPVTPKLAGSAQSSPVLSPGRQPHPNIASVARKEIPPMDGNVTPRSGTRRSRIGTESPATPGGIAAAGAKRTRAISTSDTAKRAPAIALDGTGLGISSHGTGLYNAIRPQTAGPNSASVPNLVRRTSNTRSGFASEDAGSASPFFHADDAKSSISSHDVPERPRLGPKATTFYYAGGETGSGHHSRADINRAVTNGSPRPDATKFFHANDLPAASPQHASQQPAIKKKISVISLRSPRLRSPDIQRNARSPTRPPSPLKEASYRSAPATITSPSKPKSTVTPVLTGNVRADTARRRSAGNPTSPSRKALHQKSSSTSIAGFDTRKDPNSPKSPRAVRPELQINPKSPPTQHLSRGTPELTSPVSISPRSTNLTSSNEIPARLSTFNQVDAPEPSRTSPPPLKPPDAASTPTKPPRPQSSDAANARRERKVLDLEISNSSLLAINRTLEREMRKQNAELRRFRRLSRSGRLSIRTASGQSKSSLGTLAEQEDEEDVGNESLSDFEESDSDDSTVSHSSPNSSSASAASSGHANRQRRRDEKRLMLDLSKHRQLLIDSEKMNSSIRRCLGWTEELIRDGTKALEYKVSVGDIKLGGKVLNFDHDDASDEQTEERAMGLVSPIRHMDVTEEASLWENASSGSILHGSAFDGSGFNEPGPDGLGTFSSSRPLGSGLGTDE